jgi:predicted phage tail protein
MGSKSGGVLTTILGVVLIVVGVIGETYGQAFGGGAWGPVAMKLGVALVAGGIVQMLSP